MNQYPFDQQKMQQTLEQCIAEFDTIDKLSSISMVDYYRANYKRHRLFASRSYPSSIFFFELSNRILAQLDHLPTTQFVDTYFAHNTFEPIPQYWHAFCGLTFDNSVYKFRDVHMTPCEYYYVLLLSQDYNLHQPSEWHAYLKKIRKDSAQSPQLLTSLTGT